MQNARKAAGLAVEDRIALTLDGDDELFERTMELAQRVALVPATTLQVTKDSINNTQTNMGREASLKYHFMAHHWMHNTATALNALEARKQKTSMKDVFAEHRDAPEPG